MNDDDFPAEDANVHDGPIENTNPYVLKSAFYSSISFLESYGWYIVFSLILGIVIWTNVKDSLKRFFGQRKKEHYVTDDMTPEQVETRMRAMDKARQRMQEQYDRLVEEKAEKLRQQEEQKKLQRIKDHEAMKKGKSQSGTLQKMEIKSDQAGQPPSAIKRNKDSKPMRNSDYNPLTGSSNSARWRPAPSRPSQGG